MSTDTEGTEVLHQDEPEGAKIVETDGVAFNVPGKIERIRVEDELDRKDARDPALMGDDYEPDNDGLRDPASADEIDAVNARRGELPENESSTA